jgi:FkbM family methyltransferase
MKRVLAHLLNRCLAPFGAALVPQWKLRGLTDLLPRFFLQLERIGFRPTHIFDVGAHKGTWSREAQAVFPDSAFTLIEPQFEMKPYLDQFCAEAKHARWILAGAGAAKGELPFTVTDNLGASSFTISEAEAKEAGYERRTVSVITLDSLCEDVQQPIPEMVKIDAEGFDLDVMHGSQTLLGKTELFFLELPLFDSWAGRQSFHSMVAFMRDHGYEPYDFTEFIRRPHDQALHLVETAFAKRNGVLRAYQGWD